MPKSALQRLKTGAQTALESSLDTASITAFTARVYSFILFPILLTFWLSEFFSKTDKTDTSLYMIISAFVGVLIQIAFFWHIHRLDKIKSHSLDDLNTVESAYNNLGQEYNNVRTELINSNKSNIYQKNCLHFTSLAVENSIQELQRFEEIIMGNDIAKKNELLSGHENFNEALKTLMVETEKQLIWPLASLRDELFGFESDSFYNVALYRYHQKDNLLHCKARYCDDRINRKDRSWKPGLGHVGLAFVQREVKFCNDVEHSSELTTEKVEGKIIYRSFVSIPITTIEKTGDPYGVLVLTSRHANQFDIDKDQIFLILLSKLLGLYYTVHSSLILKLNQMSIPIKPDLNDKGGSND